MEIISKEFEGYLIIFEQNNLNILINATETAKAFGKLPKDWLKTQETKNYINAVINFYNINYDELIIIKKGNFSDGSTQGTWIHQKLIIAFARWLSPEFAVWCDLTIEEILKSQIYQPIQQTQTSQLPKLTNETEQITELDNYFMATEKLISNLQNMNPTTLYRLDKYVQRNRNFSPLEHFEIDLHSQFFLPTELGRMINKSAVEINLILKHKGFQVRENGVWQITELGLDFGIEINGKFSQIKWKMKTIV